MPVVPPVAAESQATPPVAAAPKMTISPEAQAELSRMGAAFGSLKGFTAAGTFAADLDIAGQAQNDSTAFTAVYASPMKFRHEVKDQILLGNTGEKVFAFKMDDKQFIQSPAPTERMSSAELPVPLPQILRTQNPLLLFALTKDPVMELTRGATEVTRVADTDIGGTASPTVLVVSSDGTSVSIVTDSTSGLIRRMTIDLKKVFEARGAPDVKKAQLVIDYKELVVGEPAGADFAWVPPAGAVDAAAAAAAPPEAAAGGEQPMGDAAALEGKPSPDFSLLDESGAEVKIADLKGSVVVIDFWATWCPPCREGLPVLDKMATERKGKGLKVFAVNLRETKEQVAEFKAKTSLGLPVLFDTEGKVADLFKVTGIPQTVVIDREGVVRKVVIGFTPELEKSVAKMVDELLAK